MTIAVSLDLSMGWVRRTTTTGAPPGLVGGYRDSNPLPQGCDHQVRRDRIVRCMQEKGTTDDRPKGGPADGSLLPLA